MQKHQHFHAESPSLSHSPGTICKWPTFLRTACLLTSMRTSVSGDTTGPEPLVSVQRNCFGPNVGRSDSPFLSCLLSSGSADCSGDVHPSISLSVFFWFQSAVADCIMKPAHAHCRSVQGNGISSLPKVNS